MQAKYVKQFNVDEAQFQVVCGGQSPSFTISVAKKRPTAQVESDSDADHGHSASSDENDEDRAVREAKEAAQRRKSEQKAEARRERKIQKDKEASTGVLFHTYL